ncbi:MAG: SDR family oxidoreductase [Gammaproteobacteria bacterium]|nr:SDR family oxidoreductase [Gammaproteobacteria bacterium]
MTGRDLTDAVVVITGAAGGLGAAMSRRFAKAGARLALLDIDDAALGALGADLPGAVTAVCDLTDFEQVERAMAHVVASLGGVDVLINNAGLTHRSAFADTDLSVLRRVMEVNYFGAVHATKAALASIVERQGAIVAISSVAGFAPLLGRSGYVASKHALGGFFETLRAELRGTGVDVTIVAPTFVDTPFRFRTLDGDGSITDHPQSRVGSMLSPEQVADALLRAVKRRRPFVVLGRVGKLTRLLVRVTPALYERLMARSLRSELER